jgi:hypothetical protein
MRVNEWMDLAAPGLVSPAAASEAEEMSPVRALSFRALTWRSVSQSFGTRPVRARRCLLS